MRNRFGDDTRRLETGPVCPQVGQDLLDHAVIGAVRVPHEQPDPATAIDQPPDEAFHLLDVGGIDLVSLPAVIVGAIVRHDADADGLRVA